MDCKLLNLLKKFKLNKRIKQIVILDITNYCLLLLPTITVYQ